MKEINSNSNGNNSNSNSNNNPNSNGAHARTHAVVGSVTPRLYLPYQTLHVYSCVCMRARVRVCRRGVTDPTTACVRACAPLLLGLLLLLLLLLLPLLLLLLLL